MKGGILWAVVVLHTQTPWCWDMGEYMYIYIYIYVAKRVASRHRLAGKLACGPALYVCSVEH